jgi:hypothetical protein
VDRATFGSKGSGLKVVLFLCFVAAGGGVGAFSADDEFGLSLVMGAIGAVVGAALGGALLRLGGSPFGRRESHVWGDPTPDKGARWVRGRRGRPD